MRAALLCATLLLAGCARDKITLDADRWVCVKAEKVACLRPQPIGKAVMLLPYERTECVAYVMVDRG
jgi:hypothetical protein